MTAPSESHPTFGVASGGEDGARRAEKVREIAGKTFHLLLRCLPTGEERCVVGSTSALSPRQPAREEPGGCGRGTRLSVHGAGGYDSITFCRLSGSRLRGNCAPLTEPTAHGVGAPQLRLSPGLLVRVRPGRGGCLCPHRWEVNVAYMLSVGVTPTHPLPLVFVCQVFE